MWENVLTHIKWKVLQLLNPLGTWKNPSPSEAECYQPQPSALADNTYLDLDYSG